MKFAHKAVNKGLVDDSYEASTLLYEWARIRNPIFAKVQVLMVIVYNYFISGTHQRLINVRMNKALYLLAVYVFGFVTDKNIIVLVCPGISLEVFATTQTTGAVLECEKFDIKPISVHHQKNRYEDAQTPSYYHANNVGNNQITSNTVLMRQVPVAVISTRYGELLLGQFIH